MQQLASTATSLHEATRSLTTLLHALFAGAPGATIMGRGHPPQPHPEPQQAAADAVAPAGDVGVDDVDDIDDAAPLAVAVAPPPAPAMGEREGDVEVAVEMDGRGAPVAPPHAAAGTLMSQQLPADVHGAIVHTYLYDNAVAVERVAEVHRPFVRLVVSVLRHPDLDDRFKTRILHSRRAGHVFEALLAFVECASGGGMGGHQAHLLTYPHPPTHPASSQAYMQRVQKEAREFKCPQLDLDELEFQSFWSQREASRREAQRRDAAAADGHDAVGAPDVQPPPAPVVADGAGDAGDAGDVLPAAPIAAPAPPPAVPAAAPAADEAAALLGPDAPQVCSVRNFAYMQLAMLLLASGAEIDEKAPQCTSTVKDAYKAGYLTSDVAAVADRLAALEGERCKRIVVAVKRAHKLSFERRHAARVVDAAVRSYKEDAKALAVQALVEAALRDGANGLAQATAQAAAGLIREGALGGADGEKSAWAQAWAVLHTPDRLDAISQKRYADALIGVDAEHALDACVGLGDLPAFLHQWEASMFGPHRWFVDVVRLLAPPEVKTSIIERQRRRAQGLGATPPPPAAPGAP